MTGQLDPATHVVNSPDDVPPGPSVVTVGFFDGVHRGHRTIIGRAVREARYRDVRAAAVTFDRHPMEVLEPESQPRYLMSLERRVRTLVSVGLDLVLVVPFTLDFSREDPQQFVDALLVHGLQAVKVIVGANFRFGHGAAGSIRTLNQLGATRGFDAEAVSLLAMDDGPISSTQIREHLARGDVGWATGALGRPHWLDGTVVRGQGRGASIGIPTANVEVDVRMMVPAGGVYAGWVELGVGGPRHAAVTNIGTRPTFDGRGTTIETHVLDQDLDLYGRHLAVGFTHRLRAERAFDGPAELVAQIRADIAAARDLLAEG
ncbi:MAG TPA: bifunctional riboflavin kinase/FAD synthetase [Nitriliruptorales bacterium]